MDFACDLVTISLLIVVIKTEIFCGNVLISEKSVSYLQWQMWSKKEGVSAHLKWGGSASDSGSVLLVFCVQTRVVSPWCF